MPNRLSLPSLSLILFACGLLALPAPASAGFEWVAPSDSTMAAPSVSPSPMAPSVQTWPAAPVASAPLIPTAQRPTATAAPEIISPVIIGGTNPTPMLPPTSTVSRDLSSTNSNMNTDVTGAPVVGGRQMPNPMVLPPVTTLSTSSAGDIVHGFAKQVPLAVALRQILPAGYGFSVDPDVDLGVLISFQGGKPWRDTLHDALEPAGLAMREQGQMVSVGHIAPITMTDNAPMAGVMPTPHVVDMAPGAQPQMTSTQPTGPVVEEWHGERGDNLHKVIEAWTQRSHVELNWEAEYDYPLQASFNYTGTFEDAVRNLLTGFQGAHPQPIAELHNNPTLGLKVLIVQTRGNSYSD